MTRAELLQSIVPVLSRCFVVCNLGLPSQELFRIHDTDNHFYMLGSMGLCSSIGLGLSLATEAPVVAIDGDGSMLMNAGSLSTIGNRAPGNFNLLIVDNGCYGSTGSQPTCTAGRTSLAGMAKAAGCQAAAECPGEETARVLREFIGLPEPTVLVSRVLPGNASTSVIPIDPVAIGERFRRAVAGFRVRS